MFDDSKHECIEHLETTSDVSILFSSPRRMISSHIGTCSICDKDYYVENYTNTVLVDEDEVKLVKQLDDMMVQTTAELNETIDRLHQLEDRFIRLESKLKSHLGI